MDKKRDSLVLDIFEAITAMRRNLASQQTINFAECSLPPAQGEVLYIVSRRHGLSIKEIAEIMQVSGSAITQLVDALVKAGLLTREPDQKDRRTLRIGLTGEGAAKLETFKKYHLENIRRILTPLNEQELETLRDLHRKIVNYGIKLNQEQTSKAKS